MTETAESQLDILLKSVEVLKQEVDKELTSLNSPTAQVTRISSVISSFIDEALNALAGNEDMVEVNKIAITSLAQIKNFALNEPNRLSYSLAAYTEKRNAYNSCLNLIRKSIDDVIIEDDKIINEQNIEIGNENEEITDSSRSARPRSIGARPESLRKTRQEKYKNLGEESSPEDI